MRQFWKRDLKMSINSTIIVDILSKNESHKDFNLNVINKTTKLDTELTILADCTLNYLSKETGHSRICVNLKRPQSWQYRWIFINLILIRLMIKYKKYNLIFLHLPPLSQLLVCIISFILRVKSTDIYLHGELSYLKLSTGLGQRIGAKFLSIILKENWSGVRKICLSQSIQSNLSNLTYVNPKYVVSNLYEASKMQPREKAISFKKPGLIYAAGNIGKSKNFKAVNYIARNNSATNNFSIVIDGKSDDTLSLTDFDNVVQVTLRESLVPEEEYLSILDAATFVFIPQLFLSQYDLIYSGLLETCISRGIPIITKRTKYLDAVERRIGPIGLLVNEPEEICDLDFNAITSKKINLFHENMVRLSCE